MLKYKNKKMKNKFLTIENQKIVKTESNYKVKQFNNKKQNSFGKIYFNKKIPFSKYLLQK